MKIKGERRMDMTVEQAIHCIKTSIGIDNCDCFNCTMKQICEYGEDFELGKDYSEDAHKIAIEALEENEILHELVEDYQRQFEMMQEENKKLKEEMEFYDKYIEREEFNKLKEENERLKKSRDDFAEASSRYYTELQALKSQLSAVEVLEWLNKNGNLLQKLFGVSYRGSVMNEYTPQEIVSKIEEFEKRDKELASMTEYEVWHEKKEEPQFKDNTHFVIKKENMKKYLSPEESAKLVELLDKVEAHTGYKEYYICNTDEPYADKVLQAILDGEKETEPQFKVGDWVRHKDYPEEQQRQIDDFHCADGFVRVIPAGVWKIDKLESAEPQKNHLTIKDFHIGDYVKTEDGIGYVSDILKSLILVKYPDKELPQSYNPTFDYIEKIESPKEKQLCINCRSFNLEYWCNSKEEPRTCDNCKWTDKKSNEIPCCSCDEARMWEKQEEPQKNAYIKNLEFETVPPQWDGRDSKLMWDKVNQIIDIMNKERV